MAESLIEQLPKIVAEGKKEVERILERIPSPHKLTLQTNEFVLPGKDKSGLFKGQIPEFKPKVKGINDNMDELTIALDNYVLLSTDALPLDETNKGKLQEVIEKDPLALIAYWSVDPDYDGETFRSKWQDYRDNTSNDSDPHHVILEAKLKVPKVKHKRKICVKAVDVFGFESVVVKEIEQ